MRHEANSSKFRYVNNLSVNLGDTSGDFLYASTFLKAIRTLGKLESCLLRVTERLRKTLDSSCENAKIPALSPLSFQEDEEEREGAESLYLHLYL